MSAYSAAKASIVAEWQRVKRDLISDGLRGDLGYVDKDIVPLCDSLNALDGVCTLQSCAGHLDARGIASSAHLWLWLDRVRALRFEIAATALAGSAQIERVGKIYWGDGKETVTISFKGNESGLLAESSAVIFEFFERLAN